MLKTLFASKKFVVMLSGMVAYVASRLGFNVEPDVANHGVMLVTGYLVGQGMSDFGKEKAKLEASSK